MKPLPGPAAAELTVGDVPTNVPRLRPACSLRAPLGGHTRALDRPKGSPSAVTSRANSGSSWSAINA